MQCNNYSVRGECLSAPEIGTGKIGVLRLRSGFASCSRYFAQDDRFCFTTQVVFHDSVRISAAFHDAGLFHDYIHQLAGHVDLLHDLLPCDHRLYFFIS